MSEPVWKHGDIKLILRDDHTWVSKVNEPPSEFLCRILKDREKHGAQWLGYLLADLKEAGMIDKRIEEVHDPR